MKGFIALMSVIIVSVVLLGLALSGSTIAFFSRFNGLDRESYTQAQNLAHSCTDQALLQLAQDYSYAAAPQVVAIGTGRCSIDSITTLSVSAMQKEVQIQTSANYHGAFATLTTTALVEDPSTSTLQQTNPPVSNVVAY